MKEIKKITIVILCSILFLGCEQESQDSNFEESLSLEFEDMDQKGPLDDSDAIIVYDKNIVFSKEDQRIIDLLKEDNRAFTIPEYNSISKNAKTFMNTSHSKRAIANGPDPNFLFKRIRGIDYMFINDLVFNSPSNGSATFDAAGVVLAGNNNSNARPFRLVTRVYDYVKRKYTGLKTANSLGGVAYNNGTVSITTDSNGYGKLVVRSYHIASGTRKWVQAGSVYYYGAVN
jgi:hypothetical protein